MPKWIRSIDEDGRPNGCCRLNCGDFSLIERKGKKGVNYYMDFIDSQGTRHTKSLKRLEGRRVQDRNDAFLIGRKHSNKFHIEENTPEVVTGWNIELYDIPYLARRLDRVLGEKLKKRLSPWGL